MSLAWEITEDDIKVVLDAHNIKFSFEISDLVDDAIVEDEVLYYLDFDNQVTASYCSIEDQLIEAGIITGEKQFPLDISEEAEIDAVTDEDEEYAS